MGWLVQHGNSRGIVLSSVIGIVNHDDNSRKLSLIRVRGNSLTLTLCTWYSALNPGPRIPSACSRLFGCG